MLFPRVVEGTPRTAVSVTEVDDGLPILSWLGTTDAGPDGPDGFVNVDKGPGLPLLGEHARGRYTRPHLRGYRVGGDAWSTWFRVVEQSVDDTRWTLRAEDRAAGLTLVYELESVAGGGLRGRCSVTNT